MIISWNIPRLQSLFYLAGLKKSENDIIRFDEIREKRYNNI